MEKEVILIVHFNDGTKLAFQYPKQAGKDALTIIGNVRKALEADKVIVEAQGDLFIIPSGSVKYIRVSPGPDELPQGILRNARLVNHE